MMCVRIKSVQMTCVVVLCGDGREGGWMSMSVKMKRGVAEGGRR